MSPRHAPALRLNIRAQSFCHNMVRCLVSSMVAVGRGALEEGEISKRLLSGIVTSCLNRPRRRASLSLMSDTTSSKDKKESCS